MRKQPTAKNLFMAMTALTGWFALLLQLYLSIYHPYNTGLTVVGRVVGYFSYFTILTNIIVALSFTVPLLNPTSRSGRFFSSPKIISGITMFISVVGIVYFIALRNLWNPQGAQLVANVFFHYAIPLLYVVYWLAFVPKGSLAWKDAITWLVYPAIYTPLVLLRGAVSGHYPYSFLDANELGYARVLVNMAANLMVFLTVGSLLVMLDRLMSRSVRIVRSQIRN